MKQQSYPFPGTTGHSRRTLLRAACIMSAYGLLPSPAVLGQQATPLLPLDTPGLDHLDILVPDVEASARFYMALFNTRLHAQPFRGAQRYFVLLGEMNENREVGYMAIGAADGRETGIGHFCTSVANWRRDSEAIFAAMARQISEAGLGGFPGSSGFGGIFEDPDSIEIQFLPSPDTLVTAAVSSDLVEHNTGLVTPLRVDSVTLNVSDLDRALDWYRILYGQEGGRDANQAWFDFPRSDTRLILRGIEYGYESAPGIERFGIKTRAFDRQAVVSLLESLGAMVRPTRDPMMAGTVTFTDLDGITVELNPG